MAEARRWKSLVTSHVVLSGGRPKTPLKKAKLTLIRYSSTEPDADGLISGFKHVVDGLIVAGVIENDRMGNIGIPDYRWERAPRNQGKIKVVVEEI